MKFPAWPSLFAGVLAGTPDTVNRRRRHWLFRRMKPIPRAIKQGPSDQAKLQTLPARWPRITHSLYSRLRQGGSHNFGKLPLSSRADTTEPQTTRKVTARRMGAAGSPTWHAILDGAENILREEGYAALNAKQIAEHIGIKRQLVYYYFCDMDDVFVQLFHRIADRALSHLNSALASRNPLRETWHVGINTFDQTLIFEFMALASRNKRVRKEILDYTEATRNIQVAAFAKALKGRPIPRFEVPFPALAVIATWLALGVQREAALGINNGHEEVLHLIQNLVAMCDAPIE